MPTHAYAPTHAYDAQDAMPLGVRSKGSVVHHPPPHTASELRRLHYLFDSSAAWDRAWRRIACHASVPPPSPRSSATGDARGASAGGASTFAGHSRALHWRRTYRPPTTHLPLP